MVRPLRQGMLGAMLLAAFSCAEGPTPPPDTGISASARTYLSEIMAIMQANSMHRLTINWTSFRNEVLLAAGPAQTITETFPGIRKALELLGDGHSSYRAITGTFIMVHTRTCTASGGLPPDNLPANIGYVKVGAFSGNSIEALSFANGIQQTIRNADRDDLIGWIVDLRGNGGGNMWPMLAGLGPVLGEGLVGWFIDPVGQETPWYYRDGASWSDNFPVQRVDDPYTLKNVNPRVAVLVDNGVASSGEATFIAFRQRPNTRSFGVATCGASTANRAFPLSDGALLNLTVSVMADRTKVKYGDRVQPDEIVEGRSSVASRAIEWLQGVP